MKWQAMQLGMHGFGEVYATSISGGGVVCENHEVKFNHMINCDFEICF